MSQHNHNHNPRADLPAIRFNRAGSAPEIIYRYADHPGIIRIPLTGRV